MKTVLRVRGCAALLLYFYLLIILITLFVLSSPW